MDPHNTSVNSSQMMEDKEIVELFFSCRNLKDADLIGKSDPILRLLRHVDGNNWAIVGQTEVIKNDLNPDFATSFRVDFVFETKQKFKVEVTDVDDFTRNVGDFLGEAFFELADIMGSMHNLKILRLKDKKGNESGKCIVRIDKIDEQDKKMIKLKFGADEIQKSGFFSSRNSFLKLYKLRLTSTMLQRMKENDLKIENIQTDQWLLVYKSKPEKGKSISFKEFNILGSKLCNNNFDIPLKCELWKYKKGGDHKILGKTFFKINDLVSRNAFFNFQDSKKKQLDTRLIIHEFKSEDFYDFVSFLKGGLNMTLIVGVDFTASNKDPDDPTSLHYMNVPALNLYQKSILSVGEILQKYNHTRQIPAYGFGAKIGQPPIISHFFPLNNDIQNPCVSDFQELFKAYHNCVTSVLFSGPTYFAPIMSQVNDFAKRRFEQDPYNYSVFLLLTDGIINDLQKSIDEIVKGCYLPLSIIIIGIGDENFDKMEILDADDVPLVSSWGETMKRDIVQFVPFKKYMNNPLVLREEVLDEVPRQVRTFYKMKNIKPREGQYIELNELQGLQRGNTLNALQRYRDVLQSDEQNQPNYPVLDGDSRYNQL